MPVRAIFFDYDGVLTLDETGSLDVAGLARQLALDFGK